MKTGSKKLRQAVSRLTVYGITGLLLAAQLSTSLSAQGKDTVAVRMAATIQASDLKKHLTILASDEYEGRETGEKGQKMAAEYIAAHFKNLGISPCVNKTSYMQEFPLLISQPANVSLSANSKSFEQFKDFFCFPSPGNISLQSASIRFLGYGIKDEKYSDLKKAKDIKGNIVMVLGGEPMKSDSTYYVNGKKTPSDWTTNFRKKSGLFRDEGASMVLIVVDNFPAIMKQLRRFLEGGSMRLDDGKEKSDEKKESMPVIYISREMADEILSVAKTSSDKIKEKINAKGKTVSLTLKTELKLTSVKSERKTSSENVLAYIEGSDLKHELIIITAHYDHLGKQGDKVFNGADDDGSGTVALLEMAEAFMMAKKQGKGPRRSILIMPVSGEEKGLLGSKYYVQNPVFPLASTVADLNIDMIGRLDDKHKDNPNYVYLIGSDKLSSQLHAISDQANKTYVGLELDYTYNNPKDPNRFYYRSDHYNFAEKGIPIIFYFNGVHEDYHKETDEVQKIDFNKIEKITRLVFHTAWELANMDKRIVVDSNKE